MFDSHSFQPKGVISSFPFELGGTSINVEVEIMDSPFGYTLLLGGNFAYSMVLIISLVSSVIIPEKPNILGKFVPSLHYVVAKLNIKINNK